MKIASTFALRFHGLYDALIGRIDELVVLVSKRQVVRKKERGDFGIALDTGDDRFATCERIHHRPSFVL